MNLKITNDTDRIIQIGETNVAPGRGIEMDSDRFDSWKSESGHNALLAVTSLSVSKIEDEVEVEPDVEELQLEPPVEWDSTVQNEDEESEEDGGLESRTMERCLLESCRRKSQSRTCGSRKGGVNEVIALSQAVVCPAENRLRIPDESFDIVYPSGSLTDTHMDAVVKAYWEGESFTIDAMTDSTTPVADTGYSQVTNSNWTFTEENDPA